MIVYCKVFRLVLRFDLQGDPIKMLHFSKSKKGKCSEIFLVVVINYEMLIVRFSYKYCKNNKKQTKKKNPNNISLMWPDQVERNIISNSCIQFLWHLIVISCQWFSITTKSCIGNGFWFSKNSMYLFTTIGLSKNHFGLGQTCHSLRLIKSYTFILLMLTISQLLLFSIPF